ncbi:MAG: hypothetical protein AVDCRST_MAG68-2650, partial [uncultured Gemmatimonadetes bacterium]
EVPRHPAAGPFGAHSPRRAGALPAGGREHAHLAGHRPSRRRRHEGGGERPRHEDLCPGPHPGGPLPRSAPPRRAADLPDPGGM